MNLSKEQILLEMGISPIWKTREAPIQRVESAAGVESPTIEAIETAQPIKQALQDVNLNAVSGMEWSDLIACITECSACTLCKQRKQAVPGVGDLNPDWLFIGEGPGAEEDAQGEPFVGQAGKLLDNMLAALGIARGNRVYIGNAVKCRPPGNRTPDVSEITACWPYLERQISLLKPKVIVLLGKTAVLSVLKEDKSLASMRGKRLEYAGVPVVVTYHPAYLLRNLPDKAKAWEDLLFAKRMLSEAEAPGLPF